MRLWILKSRIIPRTLEIIRKMSNATSSQQKIAVCQMTSTNDKVANLNVVKKLVNDASKDNAKMIFFPEACDYICDNKVEMLEFAEPIVGGATVDVYRQLAKDNDVWLSMGGLHEKDETNPKKVYNTHILINNEGNIVQTYRKLHLFDVEIPEKNVRLKESDFASAGKHIVTPVETPIGRVGLAICYDLRFPELSTELACIGAEILTFPSAFTHATGEAHWEILLRSRAIENQCYVIASAQVGNHNAKRRSYGRAMCIDPWGRILLDCSDQSPAYKVVEINLEKLKEVRRNMPVFSHRRKDVYSLYALSLRNNILPEHEASKTETTTNTSKEENGMDAVKTESVKYEGPAHVFGHVKVPDSCVFYKSQMTYAFVNLRCVTPGHVLVAPLRAAERNHDLTEEEAADFYRTVRLVQKLMEKVHDAQSCTVTIQDGPDAGQTVKHLHCHIMPRKKGDFIQNDHIYLELAKHDMLTAGQPCKPARTLQEMEAEADTLRKELSKMNIETY